MAIIGKGQYTSYISLEHLKTLLDALHNIDPEDNFIIQPSYSNQILAIGSTKRGWVGFIDIPTETLNFYFRDKAPEAKQWLLNNKASDIQDKLYPQPDIEVKITKYREEPHGQF